MERGNTKHGPEHDEQLAHEAERMVRGTPQRPHVAEWRETEPVEDAIPPVTLGLPDRDVADRTDLARIMKRDDFPASRDALVRKVADRSPSPGLADRVARLAGGRQYSSTHDVLEALGISSPETRSGA